MLMYLGRYGRQDAVAIMTTVPMRTVASWVDRIGEFLEEEHRSADTKR